MACECGCYPNGIVQIIMLQFLLFVGMALSIAAVTDCKFAEADILGIDLPPILEDSGRTGFGFYVFQKANGDCAYNEFDNINNLYDLYQDFLGNDWRAARGCATAAAVLGIILWIASLFYICLSHPKALHITLCVFLLITTILQGISFIPLNAGWCNDRSCSFSRSAGLSVGATICFFISSCLCCLLKPYQPEPAAPVVAAAALDESKKDEEAPEEPKEEEPKEDEPKEDEPKGDEPKDEEGQGEKTDDQAAATGEGGDAAAPAEADKPAEEEPKKGGFFSWGK